MECPAENERLRETLSAAMDIKEAAAGDNPFESHMRAGDVAALLEVESSLENEMATAHPKHTRLEKLISLKESLGRAAHVFVTPEEQLWRGQLDEAVGMMDQSA